VVHGAALLGIEDVQIGCVGHFGIRINLEATTKSRFVPKHDSIATPSGLQARSPFRAMLARSNPETANRYPAPHGKSAARGERPSTYIFFRRRIDRIAGVND
jgi:hypothetical protein